MKIGMICYPSYGGSGVVATELGKKIASWGHEVHFLSYERPFKLNSFHENIFFHEIDIMDYPLFKFPPYFLALAGKIVEIAKGNGLDLVHVHYAIPHTLSAHLAREMLKDRKLPVITTLHGTDITLVGNDKQFYDVTKFSIEISDGVTAVSHSLVRETRETFNTDKEIELIYNFVDPEEYKPLRCPAIRRHFAGDGEKIIIHISNFRPLKRLKDVIEVFYLINKEVPSRLLLVGDGPEGSVAREMVNSLGLQDRVHFLGQQERVVELLSIADLFLLPSEKESFGLVALEAMACKVPVIASRTGGLPEVVIDGEVGYLAPIGGVYEMAGRGIEILTDPVKYRILAENARKHAVENFHIDSIAAKYLEYYKRFI